LPPAHITVLWRAAPPPALPKERGLRESYPFRLALSALAPGDFRPVFSTLLAAHVNGNTRDTEVALRTAPLPFKKEASPRKDHMKEKPAHMKNPRCKSLHCRWLVEAAAAATVLGVVGAD